jgi:hypothetical protein
MQYIRERLKKGRYRHPMSFFFLNTIRNVDSGKKFSVLGSLPRPPNQGLINTDFYKGNDTDRTQGGKRLDDERNSYFSQE